MKVEHAVIVMMVLFTAGVASAIIPYFPASYFPDNPVTGTNMEITVQNYQDLAFHAEFQWYRNGSLQRDVVIPFSSGIAQDTYTVTTGSWEVVVMALDYYNQVINTTSVTFYVVSSINTTPTSTPTPSITPTPSVTPVTPTPHPPSPPFGEPAPTPTPFPANTPSESQTQENTTQSGESPVNETSQIQPSENISTNTTGSEPSIPVNTTQGNHTSSFENQTVSEPEMNPAMSETPVHNTPAQSKTPVKESPPPSETPAEKVKRVPMGIIPFIVAIVIALMVRRR